jgi:hypothetical protein
MNVLKFTNGKQLDSFVQTKTKKGKYVVFVLTGHEKKKKCCFWCGKKLTGRQLRYCCTNHRTEYYRHFDWNYAADWCRKRYNYTCDICKSHYPLDKSKFAVHHITPLRGRYRSFSVYNLPWNLQLLCVEDHKKIHAKKVNNRS